MDIITTTSSHIQPIQCKNKDVYSELNTLIYEYLEVNGLEQSLATFTQECLSKNLPCPKLPSGPSREIKAAFTHYDGDLLLKSFDEGDLETFLKLWKQFQNHIQVTSEDMKKLEVYLRVHFAIYPKAKNQTEAKQTQSMQLLKTFFEENSASLSSDATILPLFALPFVADPRPHPVFKDLFHDTWTFKLRAQLETTVNKYFELLQENIQNHCKLASVVAKGKRKVVEEMTAAAAAVQATQDTTKMEKSPIQRKPSHTKSITTTTSTTTMAVMGACGQGGRSRSEVGLPQQNSVEVAIPQSIWKVTEAAILYHQDRFFQLLAIHRKARKVLRGVRENYSKLLKVSSILITALERSLSSTATSSTASNLDLILQQCLLIYPEIFTNPSNSSSPNQQVTPSTSKPDLNHFKQLAAATTSSNTSIISQTAVVTSSSGDATDVSLLFLGLPDISLDTLNYPKIKEDLTSEKVPCTDRLCLLQALRWLITKTHPNLRALVMDSFIENDLFGLTSQQDISQKLLSCILSPTPTYQKESLARLINAFASTCVGRTYLTSCQLIIEALVRSLVTFKTQEESFICHMVIATLQKLSLRRDMRRFMIEHQVIPWLVKYIKTELERDFIRSEVSQVIHSKDSNANNNSINNINNNQETSYGDTSFNTYLMEYAWALLMNLSLHPESIKSALTVDFEFLHCILTMLTSKASFEFTPYVLSTLFSLLRNPELFDKARTMDLDKKLKPLMNHQPPDIQRHLKHLLTQLYETENVDRLTASGETDYDDTDNPDPEEVEPELELPESWMVNQGATEGLLTGDDLLIREYILAKEMPLVEYSPPPPPQNATSGGTATTTTTNTTTNNPSSFSQNNSMDSYESCSDKTFRENSTESSPSKLQQQQQQPGLILRPTTPTHTKSPCISRVDSGARGSTSIASFGSLRSKSRGGHDRGSNTHSSSPPPPSVKFKQQQNPFLQQFNNMHASTIGHLIYRNSTSADVEDRAPGEFIYPQLADKDLGEDGEDGYAQPQPQIRPYTTDSVTTGMFSLHESPIMSFKNSSFLNNTTNKNFELK